jgi:hypothetical protein
VKPVVVPGLDHGLHFCPVVGVNPCPVWSSGAARFGLGIAAGANDPASFD